MNSPTTNYDIIILGAGAAGLFCAFTAARRGRRVLVLEKANKVGKKILMSGGGRCNFTNYYVDADNYLSNNPHFCKSALNRYTQWDFISMVQAHGIDYEERKHGQLFCLHSARDILDMLLEECAQTGVDIHTRCEAKTVRHLPQEDSEVSDQAPRFQLQGQQDQQPFNFRCQSLVVATGALSIPTLGGSGFGYEVAEAFGIPITPRRAGLVPFMFTDHMKPICERLSGLALEAEVCCHTACFTENILFTHRGISGPAMLQISNYWQPGDSLSVNLLPGIDACQWLLDNKQQQGGQRLKALLRQHLAKSLVDELQQLWWPESSEQRLADFSDRQLTSIGQQLNDWQLKPSATEGYRTAEVTLGGVDTDGISSKTMEAKQQQGLYFIGEVLDVTGHLGGFNFQWAWSSGYTAGLYA